MVMLLGIVTLVMLDLFRNAESPMLVTVKLFVVLGMFKTVGFPVYPVMVIAPLFVVKVNCACVTTGNANSNTPSRQI